jgi:hypothetical protein
MVAEKIIELAGPRHARRDVADDDRQGVEAECGKAG